ncbi:hypothetical protein PV325_010882 [Microctonus aethiopoides]
MSKVVRYKGKFSKQKVIDKRLKAITAMCKAKKLTENQKNINNVSIGKRIVEIDELGKNLTCDACQKDILLKNIIGETRLGLNSIFSIKCHNCSSLTNVRTGKKHTSKNGVSCSDINTKVVLGALHAGVGCTCLNKILACLNVPTISTKLFKKYEREVGPAIEEAAKNSCKRAAEEERALVIENVEELCEQL